MSSLSRRALLRAAVAGVGSAALLPKLARLAQAHSPQAVRFLFIVEGNSYDPVAVLDPGAVGAAISGSWTLTGQTLDPTKYRCWYQYYNHEEPIIVSSTNFQNTIALPSIETAGLSNRTAVVYGLSSRVTGGGHSAFHGVLSSTRTVGGAPGGITIDAYLANAVGQTTPYDAVRLGTVENYSPTRLSYQTCAFGPGKPAPAIVDPQAAYDVLFGMVDPAQMQEFAQRNTLLGFAQQNAMGALAAFNGSSAEQAKLASYNNAVSALMTRQQRLKGMAGQIAANKPSTNPNSDLTNYTNDCMYRFAAQMTNAVGALMAQLTNVVVITSATGLDFNNITYPNARQGDYRTTGRHPIHHMAYGGDAVALQTIHDMTRFQFDCIAKAARLLMTTPDPVAGGKMLDNTIIVFIGDNGEQHHSTASEFPVVLIGGSGAGLRTGGRTIVYPGIYTGGSNHRQVSNLWNTLTYVAGSKPIATDTFGGEGAIRVAPGPLGELMM
jgi:hypothetical protein